MAKKAIEKKMSADMMKEITNFVIDRLREEETATAKAKFDRKKANTKLLLRSYRSLVDHCESSTYTASQVDVESGLSLAEILDFINENASDKLKVESIRQSAVRTKIIVDHIDTMIDLYRAYCDKSPKDEDRRRYRVIYWLYLDSEPKTATDLAEEEFTDKRTIYRDVNMAVEQLTALFFGVDGLNLRNF